MTDEFDEAGTIQQAKTGDAQAYGELVAQHQLFLYNLALRAVSHPQEAEDMTQEALLRAWRALPTFRAESSFRTWLYRILMNLCYDRYPRLKRDANTASFEEDGIEPQEAYELEQSVDHHELRSLIHKHMQALPENYRLVLFLRFTEEFSYQEIAEIMAVPIGTVKTTIFRAKAAIKEQLINCREVTEWII